MILILCRQSNAHLCPLESICCLVVSDGVIFFWWRFAPESSLSVKSERAEPQVSSYTPGCLLSLDNKDQNDNSNSDPVSNTSGILISKTTGILSISILICVTLFGDA